MTMVQDADRCIEGLHMMHTDDAVLFRSAIGPVHLMPILNRRGQIRQVGAPNQLNWAIMPESCTTLIAHYFPLLNPIFFFKFLVISIGVAFVFIMSDEWGTFLFIFAYATTATSLLWF